MKKFLSNLVKILTNEIIILFSLRNIIKYCRDDNMKLYKHRYILRGPDANAKAKIITANQINKNFNRAVKHAIDCKCINSAFKNIFILCTNDKKYKVQNLIDRIYWQDDDGNMMRIKNLAASPKDYYMHIKTIIDRKKYKKMQKKLTQKYKCSVLFDRYRTHAIEHKLKKFASDACMISYIYYDINHFTTNRVISIYYHMKDEETINRIVYNRPNEEQQVA